jgi:hypothetical protein
MEGQYTADYLNRLLRGREISLSLPTPSLNLPEVEGREEEFHRLWLAAPAEDKAYVEKAIRESGLFYSQTK